MYIVCIRKCVFSNVCIRLGCFSDQACRKKLLRKADYSGSVLMKGNRFEFYALVTFFFRSRKVIAGSTKFRIR